MQRHLLNELIEELLLFRHVACLNTSLGDCSSFVVFLPKLLRRGERVLKQRAGVVKLAHEGVQELSVVRNDFFVCFKKRDVL